MRVRIQSAAVVGIDAVPVAIEVDVSSSAPATMTIVGLPDAMMRECRDRVRAALRHSGFPLPDARVVVTIAPADLSHGSSAFDLPIALGMLAGSGLLPWGDRLPFTVIGGLAFDGTLSAMRGLLAVALAARHQPGAALIFPAANLVEAAIVRDLDLYPAQSLWEATRVLTRADPTPVTVNPPLLPAESQLDDLADVRGPHSARRAIEIAAAGGHHLLLIGPPGSGKTMIARRLPGLLPPLTFDEAQEVTTIRSVAGLVAPGHGLAASRPFRAPHHTVSEVSLIGGGAARRPGELSLAHHGVLFLDALPEFSRRALESLREPLETGVVPFVRAARSVVLPARTLLVGVMQPCPCGYRDEVSRPCRCPPGAVERYRARLFGPLRDRFDLTVQLRSGPWDGCGGGGAGESSMRVRARVVATRARQRDRQQRLNGELDGPLLRQWCQLPSGTGGRLLRQAVQRWALSVPAVSGVLRVSRTIADLAGRSELDDADLAEALQLSGLGEAF